jgi:acetoacetate decarboxylase
MNIDDVRQRAFAIPLTSPAFSPGPYRFFDREYLIMTYRTDPAVLEAVLPAPLTFDEPLVKYKFIRMPDSTGFGDYTESGQVIPVKFEGQEGNYTHAMYLNDGPPIYGGRELWGFPKKYAQPSLGSDKDTLIGTLDYGPVRVATGFHGVQAQGTRPRDTQSEPGEAELPPEDHSACRRQPAHFGARLLPVGGRGR